MSTLRRRLTELANSFRRPWLRRRLGRVVVEKVDGVNLVVLPQVFNPVVFRTGTFLSQSIAALPDIDRGGDGSRPPRALDMGTGSGIGAVFAARHGYAVTAVDINPQAVRCARINALLNGLEERIEARCGDLFEAVANETFDLVLFNPPFFDGRPRDALDAAWRSADVQERFAAGLDRALRVGGQALIVLSTDGSPRLLNHFEKFRMKVEVVDRRAYGTESLLLYSVQACGKRPRLADGTPEIDVRAPLVARGEIS